MVYCSLVGFIPKALREHKFEGSGQPGVFLGWDREISNGVRCGALKECFELQKEPISEVITVTSGKFQQEEFPLIKWHRINVNEGTDWTKPVLEAMHPPMLGSTFEHLR